MIASRFGIHVAGGIPFLLQKNNTQNLISPELYSPFTMQIKPRNAACPHNIDLTQAVDDIPDWVDHPFVKLFWPTRGTAGAKLIMNPDLALLARLSRLTSPGETIERPIWWKSANRTSTFYTLTDIGPTIWTAADVHQTPEIERHIEAGLVYQRQVIIACTGRVPVFTNVEWVEPCEVPTDAPFEQIGAAILRRHMTEIQNG